MNLQSNGRLGMKIPSKIFGIRRWAWITAILLSVAAFALHMYNAQNNPFATASTPAGELAELNNVKGATMCGTYFAHVVESDRIMFILKPHFTGVNDLTLDITAVHPQNLTVRINKSVKIPRVRLNGVGDGIHAEIFLSFEEWQRSPCLRTGRTA